MLKDVFWANIGHDQEIIGIQMFHNFNDDDLHSNLHFRYANIVVYVLGGNLVKINFFNYQISHVI